MLKLHIPLLITILLFSINSHAQQEDEKSFPCRYGEEYQRLDFWLGEWDVYVKDKKSGTSSITKSGGGCTLFEDYKTESGFYGRSMNYFDPEDKLYTQIWIDKFNQITTFKEVESRKGYLQMGASKGEKNLIKMTYVLDEATGNVTQTMEGSKDGGEIWEVTFVGVYKKAKEDSNTMKTK